MVVPWALYMGVFHVFFVAFFIISVPQQQAYRGAARITTTTTYHPPSLLAHSTLTASQALSVGTTTTPGSGGANTPLTPSRTGTTPNSP